MTSMPVWSALGNFRQLIFTPTNTIELKLAAAPPP
jgi:hypothetical protein